MMTIVANDLVSIITPCYNSEKFIKETIDSVIAQTYKNWELLITDDGSTDNSIKIIRTYIEKDTRIKIFKIQNSGAAVARNNSIAKANGRYIAFLDSDDLWLPLKLEKQLDFMNQNKYALTYTSYSKITEKGNNCGEAKKRNTKLSYTDMLKSNKIGCLTAIYDQNILGKVYMPLIKKRQDYGLWLKILKQIPYAYGLNENLALYRLRNVSISSKKTEMLKWNWKLFRTVENKNTISSAYYVLWNIFIKITEK